MPDPAIQSRSLRTQLSPCEIPCGLAARQADFADALLDPEKAVPPGLIGPDGLPSAKRFAVYRNNVIAGLTATLQAAYPVVLRLVGHEFFVAMARIYVAQEPPASPVMLDYGAGFPDFLGRFEPVAALPYLRDVARLERAWVEAYHAADAAPLSPLVLAQVSAVDLPSMRLLLHPSVRVVRSVFPIVAIWQSNVDGAEVHGVDLGCGAQEALVARPGGDVEVRTLPMGAGPFIERLLAGAPIVEAVQEGRSFHTSFDLAGTLVSLIEIQVILGFDAQNGRPSRTWQEVA